MQGSFDHPPIVIRASRQAHAIGLALAAIFFFLAWHKTELGLFPLAAPGLFGLYCLWQLFDRSALILGPDGLTWRNTFVSRQFAWNEIGNFAKGPLGSVACDLYDTRSTFRWLRPLNKSAAGRHGLLGFAWEGGSRSAVAVLQSAQARWRQV